MNKEKLITPKKGTRIHCYLSLTEYIEAISLGYREQNKLVVNPITEGYIQKPSLANWWKFIYEGTSVHRK